MNLQGIIRGLEIILKYEPDAALAAEHDEVFAGSYGKTYPRMTETEKNEMGKHGWIGEERFDCWHKFV